MNEANDLRDNELPCKLGDRLDIYGSPHSF